MKRNLLTFLILLIASSAWATVDYTDTDNADIESYAPASVDTLVVISGDTLTIDDNWNASATDTTCLVLFVREGGVLNFTGNARANFGALWIGGNASAPFSSTAGGKMYMTAGDTLGLWNTNEMGANDFYFRGANCEVNIDGGASGTKAVIMGMSTSSRPHIRNDQGTGVIDIDYCHFYSLGTSVASSGLSLGASGSEWTNANGNVQYSTFDSCNVYLYGDDVTFGGYDTVTVDYDWTTDPIDIEGNKITLEGWYVEHDQESNSDQAGNSVFFGLDVDSSTLSNCQFIVTNSNGELGRASYGVRIYNNYQTFYSTTIDGFVWGISTTDNKQDVMVDSCIIINNTHEGILRQANSIDSAWVIQRSQFWGNGWEIGSGYASVLINVGPSDTYIDYKILHNTFCHSDTGGTPLTFRNHSGGGDADISGIKIVGNVFLGAGAGDKGAIRIAYYGSNVTNVVCDEMKNNWWDSLQIETGSSISIAGSAYNIADSNTNQASSFGWIDSAGFDFRTNLDSPLIDKGDSAYFVEAYHSGADACNADSAGAPGNVGYYQGLSPVAQVETTAKPSPKMNQLSLGYSQYAWPTEFSDPLRDLYADRYSWVLLDCDPLVSQVSDYKDDIDSMKIINPSFISLLYTYYHAKVPSPTNQPHKISLSDMYDWCTTNDYGMDSLILWADDSMRFNPVNNTVAGPWFTVGAGDSLYAPTYGSTERVFWDQRNPDLGWLLADFYKGWLDSFNCDGVMLDEELKMYRTDDLNDGWFEKHQFPFMNEAHWDTSGNYASYNVGLTRDWTGMSHTEICDSSRELRQGWQRVFAESLANDGYTLSPNWSSSGSPLGSPDSYNWDRETRHATVGATKSGFIGEYCAYHPSRSARVVGNHGQADNNCERDINALNKAMEGVKDSSVVMYVAQISIGAYDGNWDTVGADIMHYDRTKMNALGLMLEVQWPGNSTIRFNPHSSIPNLDDNSFMTEHSVNVAYSHGDSSGGSSSVIVDDYLVDWCGAWQKYFGNYATASNRDTSTSGTDPMGNAYTVHRLAMLKNDSSDTLTYAVGRYCRGDEEYPQRTIDSSGVWVTAPVEGMYELSVDGYWYEYFADSVFLANGHWKIFSTDPVMSDTGYVLTGTEEEESVSGKLTPIFR